MAQRWQIDEIKIGDEVTVNGVKGIVIREPYSI